MRIRTTLAVLALTGAALLTTAGVAAADDSSNGSVSVNYSDDTLANSIVSSNLTLLSCQTAPQYC